jgi:hypothetical protein
MRPLKILISLLAGLMVVLSGLYIYEWTRPQQTESEKMREKMMTECTQSHTCREHFMGRSASPRLATCPHPHEFYYWKRLGQCYEEQRGILWCSDADGKIAEIRNDSFGPISAAPIAPAEQGPSLPQKPAAHGPNASYDRDPEYNKPLAKIDTPQPQAQSTYAPPDEPWSCASGNLIPWRNDIVAKLDVVPETFPPGTP